MDIKRIYEERYNEVSDYLQLLKFVDDLATTETWSGKKYDKSIITYQPQRDMQKILRANTYLLMYNLVESTFAMMIEYVQTHINDEKKPLLNFIPEIRKICAKSCFKISEDAIEHMASNKPIYIDDWKLSYSGNVTMQSIKSFLGTIKCAPKTTLNEKDVEASLEKIKQTRNCLAHGNMSFADKGTSITYDAAKEDFEKATQYLREMLSNLERYVQNTEYLAKP